MSFEISDIASFWDYYPDSDVIPEFKALRNKRGDTISSFLMWYLRFNYDPEHEYVQKLPKKEREELLQKYFKLKKSDLNSSVFKNAENWYYKNFLDTKKRTLALLRIKHEEMEEAIRTNAIHHPDDILKFTQSIQGVREFFRELDNAEKEVKSGLNKRTIKAYGKEQRVNGAEDGSLWEE